MFTCFPLRFSSYFVFLFFVSDSFFFPPVCFPHPTNSNCIGHRHLRSSILDRCQSCVQSNPSYPPLPSSHASFPLTERSLTITIEITEETGQNERTTHALDGGDVDFFLSRRLPRKHSTPYTDTHTHGIHRYVCVSTSLPFFL